MTVPHQPPTHPEGLRELEGILAAQVFPRHGVGQQPRQDCCRRATGGHDHLQAS
jgi:hypothetical protein